MSDFTQAVQLAYHCVLFMVEPDATREEAEEAIDHAPKLRRGMSFAVRAAVLEKFEPAERDPIAFVDYLPESFAKVSDEPERTMFSHCNWIGGCDTELTKADGSLLCREHVEAPLADAMAIYARELQGKGRVSEHGESVAL